jgi:acetolactate synthase-1/2/3 large subunit
MGWAIGAAVGIARANPECPVVCITGDGSYLMNGQEISVAAEEKLPVLFIVLNDAALGMVKHGQRMAGAEPTAFQLPRVNFAMLAESMDVPGYIVHSPEDLEALDFDKLLQRNGPSLIDVRIDGEEIPPMSVRMRALAAGKNNS